MRVLNFIKENKDWRQLLTQPPYNLKIVEEPPYILLKYDMRTSDMSEEIVQECRGLILKEDIYCAAEWVFNEKRNTPSRMDLYEYNYCVVCRGFDKFFNYGEYQAASIDWESAVIQEKVDGSLIKIWWDDKWRISTNGTINAFKTPVGDGQVIKSFGHLFLEAIKDSAIFKEKNIIEPEEKDLQLWCEHNVLENITLDVWWSLNKDYTYMFELVSPYNRVVVPYTKAEIYLLGIRNIKTGQEYTGELNFINAKPVKQYPLKSLSDCLKATEAMGYDEEGFVVVDKDFNRIKIKSPQYIAAHYLKNNGVQTTERLLNIIIEGEEEEFLNYFPEYKDSILNIKEYYETIIAEIEEAKDNMLKACKTYNRKELAEWIRSNVDSNYTNAMFNLYDKKSKDAKEWFNKLFKDKKVELINRRK